MSKNIVVVWDNRDAPGGATNTLRGLTRSSDSTREGLLMESTRTCSIEGCDRPLNHRGLCAAHYSRLLRNGSTGSATVGPSKARDFESPGYAREVWARLLARRTVTESGCWEWDGTRQPNGYGRVSWKGVSRFTHRVAYEIAKGEIPDGLVIDHLCRNRACFNPDHLEAVTHQINLLRGETVTASRAAVTHCPQGHEYTDKNTYWSSRNQRSCRACGRIKARLRYAEVAS